MATIIQELIFYRDYRYLLLQQSHGGSERTGDPTVKLFRAADELQ